MKTAADGRETWREISPREAEEVDLGRLVGRFNVLGELVPGLTDSRIGAHDGRIQSLTSRLYDVGILWIGREEIRLPLSRSADYEPIQYYWYLNGDRRNSNLTET